MASGGTPARRRRVVGAAGLGYVVLAAVENLDLQSVPALDGSAADVVAYYGQDVAAKVLAAVVGLVALGCYAGFALPLCASVTRGRLGVAATVWRAVAMVAAVVGPLLALVAVGLRTWLATAVDSLSAAEAVAAHQTVLGLRVAGGTCLGVVLLVLGLVGLGEVLPRWFRTAAVAVGGWILATALVVAATAGEIGYWFSFAGFTADVAWVGFAAGFLVLAPAAGTAWPPWPVTAATSLFGLVALAAGVSGLALTALPNSTASYFSWPLKPAALAALIGGCYLAASLCYGLALVGGGPGRRWDEAQGLLLAIVALSVPMAVTSVVHADAFDFAFWPAWAWFGLFFAFPAAAFATIVGGLRAALGRGGDDGHDRRRAATWVRGLYLGCCLAGAAGATALWTGRTGWFPVTVGEFGAQVFACWWAFLAVVAGWTALRPVATGAAGLVVLVAMPLAWTIESARGLAGWDGADSTRWLVGLGVAVMSTVAVGAVLWRSRGQSRDVGAPLRQP